MDIKDLERIYEYMAKAYEGNWQYRFGDTPFMTKTNLANKRESILAHQWSLMEFWFILRRSCPNLNKAVDTIKLYEMLMNHDLGETVGGDISQTTQLSGGGLNKVLDEHNAILSLTKSLPLPVSRDIINLFELYETEIDSADEVEQLVARFIDYLQGNQFTLTFGNNLPDHSELIAKIVKNWWARYARKLIDVLKEKGFKEASEEIRQISNAHIKIIGTAGIKLEFEGFN